MHDKRNEIQHEDASAIESGRRYVPGFGYDFLLPLYDPLQALLGWKEYHAALVEQAALRPGQRVLEIGCGTGNLVLHVKLRHPDVLVVGLDPDAKALARARRKAHRESLAIQFDRGFAERLPYPDQSFDRVFSAFMFHHLDTKDQLETLREARRVLMPGGSLHLLDIGGDRDRSDGFLARLSHHSERLGRNFGGRIQVLMLDAGFSDPTEVDHRVSKLGRFAFFRAFAPAVTGGLVAVDPIS